MNLAFEIDLDPDLQRVLSELGRSVEEVTAKIVKTIAEDAPGEMQAIMAGSSPSGKPAPGGGKHSAKGQAPAIVTRELFRSLQGKVVSPTEAEILMADHGFYLDPLFEGEPGGGGYLDRPFIELGLNRTIAKSLSDL